MYGVGGFRIFRDIDDGVAGGISLDLAGKPTKQRKYSTTVVTTIRNKQTGRYAGKTKIEYESGHNASMDEMPPIDPNTGRPLEGYQAPLDGILSESDSV